MDNLQQIKEELIRKFQQCMSEVGLKPEVEVSSCEAVVAAKQEIQGETLRVVAHVNSCDVKPSNQGGAEPQIAQQRLVTAMVRPTLASQVATQAPEIKNPDIGSN